MTQQPPAAPTLHPKRCETCKCESCYFHPSKKEWREGMTDGMDMCPIRISTFTGRYGCCSHSSILDADAWKSANIPTELPEEMPFTPDEIPQKKFVITASEFGKMFDAWMFSTKDVLELHAIQNKVQSRAISIGHTSGCDCARCHTYKTSGYYLCEECYAVIALLKDGVK